MIRFADLKWAFLCVFCAVCALCGCSDDDASPRLPGKANITMLVPEYSPFGDLSYNDQALTGVMLASSYTNTSLKLLYPTAYTPADSLYRAWLEENADKDSCVLILCSPFYADIVRQYPPRITGRGTRILLYETPDTIEGVTTFQINRYGISYLAGAMSFFKPAYVLAAMKGNKPTDEAVRGYLDGHQYGRTHEPDAFTRYRDTVFYLGDDESYFNRPLEAFNFMSDLRPRDYILFPLLGGSNKGVVNYYTLNSYLGEFFIGMDVYQGNQCIYVPFSVIINIGSVLNQYVNSWKEGRQWPQAKSFNMEDGWVNIETTDNIAETVNTYSAFMNIGVKIMFRDNPDTLSVLYNKYKNIAVQKEKEYYGK